MAEDAKQPGAYRVEGELHVDGAIPHDELEAHLTRVAAAFPAGYLTLKLVGEAEPSSVRRINARAMTDFAEDGDQYTVQAARMGWNAIGRAFLSDPPLPFARLLDYRYVPEDPTQLGAEAELGGLLLTSFVDYVGALKAAVAKERGVARQRLATQLIGSGAGRVVFDFLVAYADRAATELAQKT